MNREKYFLQVGCLAAVLAFFGGVCGQGKGIMKRIN